MEYLHVLKLIIIFFVIIICLWKKRPLYQAVIVGIVTIILLYQINLENVLLILYDASIKWSNISVVLVMYSITFLQRILESRKQIMYAYQDLDNIFHSRRINATVAALFIGLLPSAAAMILCGDIVKEATDGYLDKKEQAFVTSWFRHIPESALPTYPSVLLMSSIASIGVPQFLIGMIIPMILLFLLGYLPYIRKIPKSKSKQSKIKFEDIKSLFKHLWSLFGILFLILVFNLPVLYAVVIIIVMSIFVYKVKMKEVKSLIISAFEPKLLLNIFLVLVLKEFIVFTGILAALPTVFSQLPIPMYLVFVLLFLVGTLISGTNGIIALGGPLAFATVQNAGIPLMVLLMSICHVANQISPTHVCLVVATEYFDVSLGDLIKKTIPILSVFCLLMIIYYHILLMIGL